MIRTWSRVFLALLMILIMMSCGKPLKNEQITFEDTLHTRFSKKSMGLSIENGQHVFRLFAPSADEVRLHLFQQHDDSSGDIHEMRKSSAGVWEVNIDGEFPWKYYAYTLDGPDTPDYQFEPAKLIADPWSRAVVRQNHYSYPSKTVILPEDDYDWEGDTFLGADLADLVILESHLRDMTVHPSSGAQQPGTYRGFVEADQRGGIVHLTDLGINAVEFLPVQEFGNIEIDYKNEDLSTYNDWNPYESNHWGYMTSFFFAPEIYYGSDGTRQRGVWLGKDGRAVNEFKDMVKALHKAGIAVIIDVVYNHVSQYDENPFKYIDKAYYFRLDVNGDYLSLSGCGNDFRTESPMARRMIVESLVYWMEEYHVDGFRFDLAAMIDYKTVDAITEATRKVNPKVILIGEPWGGGGYNPKELADHGWASWNDHFRNSIKGRSPWNGDYGFIFGKFWDGNDREHYKRLMRGYLQTEGGHYREPAQSVNYLESHDDNTMGDFIRHALGDVAEHEKVTRARVASLTPQQLKIHKFAALNLLTSQGPVMMHAGQSWGRAKVIAETTVDNPRVGELDHNSYEKDDETNWLNWDEKALNRALVDYYRGLIDMRKASPALRSADPEARSFIDGDLDLAFGFLARAEDDEVLVLLNGDPQKTASFSLPSGNWQVRVNDRVAEVNNPTPIKDALKVAPQSGMVLVKAAD